MVTWNRINNKRSCYERNTSITKWRIGMHDVSWAKPTYFTRKVKWQEKEGEREKKRDSERASGEKNIINCMHHTQHTSVWVIRARSVLNGCDKRPWRGMCWKRTNIPLPDASRVLPEKRWASQRPQSHMRFHNLGVEIEPCGAVPSTRYSED